MPSGEAFLRLIRASLAPSALADVAAGACAGAAMGGRPESARLGLCAISSLAMYHAGMALNDYADRDLDSRACPGRPIPSGGISPPFALAAGLSGIGLSLAAASIAGRAPLLLAAPLATLVLAYDFVTKRSGLLGPLTLGACRALNLLLGAAASGPRSLRPELLAVAAGYSLYIVLVSHLARMEDSVVNHRRARRLAIAAPAALLAPVAALPSRWGLLVAALSAAWLRTPAVGVATPEGVRRVVGRLLGGTILLNASVATASGFPIVGAGLALLYPVARRLARRFPPT